MLASLSWLIVIAVSAHQTSQTSPDMFGEVTVTARRDIENYDRCLAARCAPEDEVEAALNASIAYFKAGNYVRARNILRKTIGRVRKYAGGMPVKMADLYGTLADLSWHGGYKSEYRAATYAGVDVLRDHLGRQNPNTLVMRARIGDMLTNDEQPRVADNVYRSVEREAREAGQLRIAANVAIRRAWLSVLGKDDRRATQILDRISADLKAGDRLASIVLAIRLRIAIAQNDETSIDRLLAEWQPSPGALPALLSEPPDPDLRPGDIAIFRPDGSRGGGTDAMGWVDIGYWIRPSGSVNQVEVLRPAGAEKPYRQLARQIAGRRYTPSREPDSPGTYRIERVSIRQDFGRAIGMRIPSRHGPVRLVRYDLIEPIARAKDAVYKTPTKETQADR